MVKLVLSLGSNLGDRFLNLKTACARLTESGLVIDIKSSSVYETEPQDMKSENSFFNTLIVCQTNISPVEILNLIKSIETYMGRVQSPVYQDRIIDIDIISYGDKIVRAHNLIIPHPKMHLRPFVLVPLQEIDAGFTHPVLNFNPAQMLSKIKGNYKVKKVEGIQLDGQIKNNT